MTEIATVGPSTGALALRADQHHFTDEQHAALVQLGIDKASPGDLAVFMHVAQRTGLDPFSRQIHLIGRNERQDDGTYRKRWTIQTGVDGFRIIAGRSGVYRGQVGPEWCGEDGVWRDVWLAATPPVAARVGVLRADFDQPVYGVALFREYAQTKRGGDLTSMWQTKGVLMIAKCAEVAALRKAFPHDLAGLLAPEEVDRGEPAAPRAVAQRVTAAELTGQPTVDVDSVRAAVAACDTVEQLHAIRDDINAAGLAALARERVAAIEEAERFAEQTEMEAELAEQDGASS